MHNELNEPLLYELAAIGCTEEWHRLETMLPADELESAGRMMYQNFESWRALAASWNPRDLIGLIKALTIAERRLKGWNSGSGSPVRVLYQELSIPSSEKEALADWVLQHTESIWIPFTNFGARSLADYPIRAAEVEARREWVKWEERQRRARRAEKATRFLAPAVRGGDVKAVISLLAKGADPLAKDTGSLSALETAEERGQIEILKILQDAIRRREQSGEQH